MNRILITCYLVLATLFASSQCCCASQQLAQMITRHFTELHADSAADCCCLSAHRRDDDRSDQSDSSENPHRCECVKKAAISDLSSFTLETSGAFFAPVFDSEDSVTVCSLPPVIRATGRLEASCSPSFSSRLGRDLVIAKHSFRC